MKTSSQKKEQILLISTILIGILFILFGIYLSNVYHDFHWMNRAGAAIVSLEIAIALLEVGRQKRLKIARNKAKEQWKSKTNFNPDEKQLEFLDSEIEKSEYHIIIIASIFAFVGEILHGFGDIIFSAVFGITSQTH